MNQTHSSVDELTSKKLQDLRGQEKNHLPLLLPSLRTSFILHFFLWVGQAGILLGTASVSLVVCFCLSDLLLGLGVLEVWAWDVDWLLELFPFGVLAIWFWFAAGLLALFPLKTGLPLGVFEGWELDSSSGLLTPLPRAAMFLSFWPEKCLMQITFSISEPSVTAVDLLESLGVWQTLQTICEAGFSRVQAEHDHSVSDSLGISVEVFTQPSRLFFLGRVLQYEPRQRKPVFWGLWPVKTQICMFGYRD